MQHSQSEFDLAACQGVARAAHRIVGGGRRGHLALGAIKRGARVTLLCAGPAEQNTQTQKSGLAGPETTSRLFVLNRLHPRRQQVRSFAMRFRSQPSSFAKLHQARQQGSLANSMSHCEVEEGFAGVQAVADSLPRCWQRPPPGSRHHPLCCASYCGNGPIDADR